MDNRLKNFLLSPFNLLYKISPATELKLMFRLKQGYKLNLKSPTTYNEKLQWIKLNDKNPLMSKCCDKYTVRQYVEDCGCSEILNHLIWQGFDPEEIPFDSLPDKFVIKVTHGSTFNIICKNKATLNISETKQKLKKWLNAKFLPCYGEWFYGVEPPRIIVEDFIESDDGEQLKDYKIFCFNGKPKLIRVDTGRFTDHKMTVYDTDWNRLDNAHMGCEYAPIELEKLTCLNNLLNYASKLSSPFHHARVDFYIVNNRIIFGEITFTNGAGFDRFSPKELDIQMGKWLELPIVK